MAAPSFIQAVHSSMVSKIAAVIFPICVGSSMPSIVLEKPLVGKLGIMDQRAALKYDKNAAAQRVKDAHKPAPIYRTMEFSSRKP